MVYNNNFRRGNRQFGQFILMVMTLNAHKFTCNESHDQVIMSQSMYFIAVTQRVNQQPRAKKYRPLSSCRKFILCVLRRIFVCFARHFILMPTMHIFAPTQPIDAVYNFLSIDRRKIGPFNVSFLSKYSKCCPHSADLSHRIRDTKTFSIKCFLIQCLCELSFQIVRQSIMFHLNLFNTKDSYLL